MGCTGARVVLLGQFPRSDKSDPNVSPVPAQLVPLPASILGRIDRAGDTDFYKFNAREGDHLIFDVHATRVGSPLEPVLTVRNAAGRELPRTLEYHDGDPMLIFDCPADGPYLLEVRDLQYRGG